MRAALPFCLAAILMLTACSKPAPKAAGPLPHDPSQPAPAPSAEDGIDIGDVEFNISCVVTTTAAPNLRVNEVEDYNKEIKMVTADLMSGSAPTELPIKCTLKCKTSFADTPVVLRANVFRETAPGQREIIGTFSAVAGKEANKFPQRNGMDNAVWTFDAMKGLTTPPESLLVMAEVTMLLMPAGTDEASLNPDTAQANSGYSTVEVSNPLRVNLVAPTGAAAQ